MWNIYLKLSELIFIYEAFGKYILLDLMAGEKRGRMNFYIVLLTREHAFPKEWFLFITSFVDHCYFGGIYAAFCFFFLYSKRVKKTL